MQAWPRHRRSQERVCRGSVLTGKSEDNPPFWEVPRERAWAPLSLLNIKRLYILIKDKDFQSLMESTLLSKAPSPLQPEPVGRAGGKLPPLPRSPCEAPAGPGRPSQPNEARSRQAAPVGCHPRAPAAVGSSPPFPPWLLQTHGFLPRGAHRPSQDGVGGRRHAHPDWETAQLPGAF